MPLEGLHLILCIENELRRSNLLDAAESKVSAHVSTSNAKDLDPFHDLVSRTPDFLSLAINFVLGELDWDPSDSRLFSVSGCKRVHEKIHFFLEQMLDSENYGRTEL
ncbi:unnamed protein product [Protopolystoma xenopodis]|uniref:Uncharacterized protein n=1 Tax=Protopolystoma xenopodis TaxID=117903 RepID=A0A448XIV9_9PLAT|nr:unnamed protein product [Protopolystoma xenopodis]